MLFDAYGRRLDGFSGGPFAPLLAEQLRRIHAQPWPWPAMVYGPNGRVAEGTKGQVITFTRYENLTPPEPLPD